MKVLIFVVSFLVGIQSFAGGGQSLEVVTDEATVGLTSCDKSCTNFLPKKLIFTEILGASGKTTGRATGFQLLDVRGRALVKFKVLSSESSAGRVAYNAISERGYPEVYLKMKLVVLPFENRLDGKARYFAHVQNVDVDGKLSGSLAFEGIVSNPWM